MSGEQDGLPPRPVDDDANAEPDANCPEVSLRELSQAYAEVLKQQEADGDGSSEQLDARAAGAAVETTGDPEGRPSAAGPLDLEQIDANDNAPCPVSPQSIVEAILFTGTPEGVVLTDRKIAAAMRDVSPDEVRRCVQALNREYQSQNSAFRIVEKNGHFSLQLIEALDEVQSDYYGRNRAARLSQSVINALAIVAYHQPVSRSDVDRIRARPSGSVLNQLLRRDLIATDDSENAAGKSQGRTYRTTARFLELFGLQSLKDLPQTSAVSDLEELTDH